VQKRTYLEANYAGISHSGQNNSPNKKRLRDRARQKAEKRQIIARGKENAKLKHQITQSKRNSWNVFLSKLNYKTDGQKAFKFMNKLNNTHSQKQSQPLKTQDKEITDDKKNCKLL
jgi:hypothetical protein